VPRVTAKRRAGIDAGRLKAHEARRWSALRLRTCLLVCDALSADDNSKQKALLDRRVAMLTKLGQRGDAVSEELGG
jgi:hypothetical protein